MVGWDKDLSRLMRLLENYYEEYAKGCIQRLLISNEGSVEIEYYYLLV